MTDAVPPGHVFLVGFMGAGKSTVGAILADKLGRRFVDLDAEIEKADGRPVAQIFAEQGEEVFRALESEALARLADEEPLVVACGGGIVLRAVNRRLLKELGTVAYLEVTAGEALARIGDVEGRPLLAAGDPSAAAALLDARLALYRAAADITIDTDASEPAELAAALADALAHGGGSR